MHNIPAETVGVLGEEDEVFRVIPGDPHPVGYLRVLLGVEMCRSAYGAGPWDDLALAWWTSPTPSPAARPAWLTAARLRPA